MSEKIYTLEEIKDILIPILQKYNASNAILFGSYARNEATSNSDIDVMVVGGSSFVPTDVFCIAEDIHRTTRKAVDVYEQREIDTDSLFYRTIMNEGIELR